MSVDETAKRQFSNERAESGNVAAAIEAGKQIASGLFTKVPGVNPLLLAHKDLTLVDLSDYQRPREFLSNAAFDSLESFISYVNQYKQENAHVYAQAKPESLTFRAVLSYVDKDGHDAALDVPVDPRREAILAHFQAVQSEELKVWRTRNGSLFSQSEFADWLEMRALDIFQPAAADILEMVQNFESKRDVSFKSAVRMADGSVTIAYEDQEKHTSKAALSFPPALILSIPLFRGFPHVHLEAKLRYKVQDGVLRLSYHLLQLHNIFDGEIERAIERVSEKTALVVYSGDLCAMPDLFRRS